MFSLRPLLFLLLLLATAADVITAQSTRLNVTAIGAHAGRSRFECWEVSVPFVSSSQSGISGTQTTSLGDVSNMTYNVIPAGYQSGFHTAPVKQWVIVLNGLAVLTLPGNSSATATTSAGEIGLLFAADTPDVSELGHGAYFPGVSETVFVQIPTRDGAVPEHRVISEDAACSPAEFVQLRSWAI
ncbi:hypothetical protein F5X96DRAFT_625449 [Biscogniauxia mediterranea]|nr:hypothetical protein F5X96DRAFT_625449 [Biscogniauxia mediterranea]